MKKQNNLKISAIGVLIALTLAGCGSKKASQTEVVNMSTGTEITTLDSSKAIDDTSLTQIFNFNEGLYRIGNKSKILPGIAKQVTESKNGKKYIFTLRKDAKWSNGDKVTAQDFVYAWQRTVNPKTASEFAYLYSGIHNADKISAEKASVKTLGIKATGKYKLTVTLDTPIPYFKLLMGFPSFFPQNQKVVEKYGSKYGSSSKDMVYDGPFIQKGWTGSNLSWKMIKNPNYWDKTSVKLTQMNFQVIKDTTTGLNLYNSKKLDETTLSGSQVAQYKNNKNFMSRKLAQTSYIEFNQSKNTVLKNKKIRQALSLAIDRDQLTGKVLADGSVSATGFVSSGLMTDLNNGKDFAAEASVPSGVSYNLQKAKKLMAEGLKEENKKTLTLDLLNNDSDVGKKASEFLQSDWKKLPGVKITLTNIPYKSFLTDEANKKFDLALSGWAADFSDPISFLQILTSDNAQNNGSWKNVAFDKAIEKADTTDATNPEKRFKDMIQAEKILMQDQGVAPIYQSTQAQLWNQNVKGLVHNSAGIYYDYKNLNVTK
ncbi:MULTISPECIES: peptide ABC transporter substrate-binding protein [Pediococcus]|uniref:peptide ABC transporter substrate-binding protein n=1 Tax=Pediococcus TaxID=1253 RepID=UPI000E9083EB|nr:MULTISPECIES: peptide ABC transporter substrate-binding protein [Pediococcus]MCT3028573.1 peptide ABC transporter substrate-binding protein [Pediococcus parvulus]HBO47662.1 peptide ABC transporter substrate-binding protein [Pediococcus sp.]